MSSEDLVAPAVALVDERLRTRLAAVQPRRPRRRGWLIRRALLLADVVGLVLALLVVERLLGVHARGEHARAALTYGVFLASLPAWVVLAKLEGLYDRDEERADHTTVDELAGVFRFVTIGTWILYAGVSLIGIVHPSPSGAIAFWIAATALVTLTRTSARAICRRSAAYRQKTVIVGAGDVGQLVARKMLRHPEYGLELVGFVDRDPKALDADLRGIEVVAPAERLRELVRERGVERVVVAFSSDDDEATVELVRQLKALNVQIDIVPRLYETVGPNVSVHTLEALPLVGLPPARLSRSSRLLKRAIDIVGAGTGLVLTAPLFLLIALAIKRSSPGPILFRQTRYGLGMREFTLLKFRTMKTGTDDAPHRQYINDALLARIGERSRGLAKLDRGADVTAIGRWLRRSSLDELPQLVNVMRGEMSLVGPRPCIPYETENFAPHHFDRFLVPAGLTGLWQVTARAQSTFAEALEMDVAYAHGWSLRLDVWLILRTFRHLAARATL